MKKMVLFFLFLVFTPNCGENLKDDLAGDAATEEEEEPGEPCWVSNSEYSYYYSGGVSSPCDYFSGERCADAEGRGKEYLCLCSDYRIVFIDLEGRSGDPILRDYSARTEGINIDLADDGGPPVIYRVKNSDEEEEYRWDCYNLGSQGKMYDYRDFLIEVFCPIPKNYCG